MTTMNKNLGLLLSGQLVSQIGDKCHMLALSLWVLKTTGSPAKMGIVIFASLAPLIAVGFLSGAVVDRWDRRKIIIGTDMIRAAIMLAVAAAYAVHQLSFAGVIVAQVLLAVNTAFFNPAIPAVISHIVAADRLTRANAKVQFIAGFSTIVGPILGGVAVAAAGYGPVFFINGLSFAVSALFECFLAMPPAAGSRTRRGGFLRSVGDGYIYFWREKSLLIIAVMVAVIHFFVGSIEVIMPVLARSLGGNNAENLGLLQGFFGAGTVIMAALISVLRLDGKEARLLFGAVSGVGITYVLTGGLGATAHRSVYPFLLIFLMFGGAIVLAATSFQSILQKQVPAALTGRVFAVVGSVGNATVPLAALAYGVLLTYVGCAPLLMITGMVLAVLGVVFYGLFTLVGSARLAQR